MDISRQLKMIEPLKHDIESNINSALSTYRMLYSLNVTQRGLNRDQLTSMFILALMMADVAGITTLDEKSYNLFKDLRTGEEEVLLLCSQTYIKMDKIEKEEDMLIVYASLEKLAHMIASIIKHTATTHDVDFDDIIYSNVNKVVEKLLK